MAELEARIKHGVSIIDFGAPWFAPCYLQKPILDSIAHQFQGRVLVAAVNIYHHRDIAAKLHIRDIPTLIFYQDRKEIHRLAGLQSESTLCRALETLLEGIKGR